MQPIHELEKLQRYCTVEDLWFEEMYQANSMFPIVGQLWQLINNGVYSQVSGKG